MFSGCFEHLLPAFSVFYAYVFDGIISQSLNMKFEYKKPRVTKKEKGV